MAKRFKIKEGDIFTIPIDTDNVGIGQILYLSKHEFLMVVFENTFKTMNSIVLSNINNFKIIFLGWTVDAKIYNNKWIIIDNIISNLHSIKLPYYKLGLPADHPKLVNHKGETVAENISEQQFNSLTYQTQVSPVRFENALKAYFGLQEWKSDDYDILLYQRTIDAAEIAEEILKN